MAASSLLALIDDIATILDDVSLMTKMAAEKTAGVLGDDLALNAQQVAGIKADRELPVVWAVAKGSFKNKLILVPAALAISAIIPWAVIPLLMIGGLFLCFEGVEKLAHKFLHKPKEEQREQKELIEAANNPGVDLVAFEKEKIKGAVRTDFVLSAEIITITLGTVATAHFAKQVAVLSAISIIMTVGVYGLVAGIVKIDDLGLALIKRPGKNLLGRFRNRIGRILLLSAPYLMRTLSVVGTIAMFMVGGGILTHGIHVVDEYIHYIAYMIGSLPYAGKLLQFITPVTLNAIFGVFAGILALVVWSFFRSLVVYVRRQRCSL